MSARERGISVVADTLGAHRFDGRRTSDPAYCAGCQWTCVAGFEQLEAHREHQAEMVVTALEAEMGPDADQPYESADDPAINLLTAIYDPAGYWESRCHAAESPGAVAPECVDHRETQHRDGNPPWCRACGWHHGRPATPPVQIGGAS